MGADYSSPLVDSNLVFPAPPPSYAADTDDLLWLRPTSGAECAVPAFLITPKGSRTGARSPVRSGRQESQQQQQQQTQQEQQEHREQQGAQQQKQQCGHCHEDYCEVRHDQQLCETRACAEATSRELQWRRLQQAELQQCQQQSAGRSQHQQSSSSQQCRNVHRQSSLQQHMFEPHFPDSQEQLFQACRQRYVPSVQRTSLLQQELQAAPVRAFMPRLVRQASTSNVYSKATHPRKFLSASDAVASDGAFNCCIGGPNATSNATAAKEGNWTQQHGKPTTTGKGAVVDAASVCAHAASTSATKQASLKDGPCKRYYSHVSDLQQQEHLEDQQNQRQQPDKHSNQRSRGLTVRRSRSWSSIPGRSHKYGQGFCMLYFHGNACDANMMRGWLQVLADEVGLTILVFEYPGYGLLNQEDKSSRGVDLCARTAFEYIVQSLRYPIEKIILCGRSIGTGAAAWLARELGGSALYVGGLVLIAPFLSLAKVAADWTDAPVSLMQILVHNHWNTDDALRCVPNVPLCIIHGKMDDVIPVAHSKHLTDAAPRPPWLRVIHLPETAGHDVGLTPSSLLLDVVAPLQLFLSKVAAANLQRKLDAQQLHQSFFQEMSSTRRCRISVRAQYAYGHDIEEHHQQASSQQQRQQRTQNQHLQLHLHEKEVHTQVKRVHHSLPVHARPSCLRYARARDFSAFLDAARDSGSKGRPLREIVQKHLLRWMRHRRQITFSRRLEEPSQNRCLPPRFPSDFLTRSSEQEKSAQIRLFPCHSARQQQQIGLLQHAHKQRQCQQRPPPDSYVKDTENSQAFYIGNHRYGEKGRGQPRSFEPVKHCSRQPHVLPGHIRCAGNPTCTTDRSRSSGALCSRVITVSLEPPVCTERAIASEIPPGFRITGAAGATQRQVLRQHVVQQIERETAEGGQRGEGRKYCQQPRKRGLRTEREEKAQPPRIRYTFLSCTFWDDVTTEKPRPVHVLPASNDVSLENKNSNFLNMCRAAGQSSCTQTQHPIAHSLPSAWRVRSAEDVASAGPLSVAPTAFSCSNNSERDDGKKDVDCCSTAKLARADPSATKKADCHAWPPAPKLSISKNFSVSVTAAHEKAATFFREVVVPPPVERNHRSAPLSLLKAQCNSMACVQTSQRCRPHQLGMQRQSNPQHDIQDGSGPELRRGYGNQRRRLFTAKQELLDQRMRRGSGGEETSS